MTAPRDSERTKAEILASARRLFAERGIVSVSIRDVAKEAGVTHGLVHHYFGTKEQLIGEVIKSVHARGAGVLTANPLEAGTDAKEATRRVVRHFLTEGRGTTLLLARAELAGLEPDRFLTPGAAGPLGMMAERFGELQQQLMEPGAPRSDPAMLSVCVAASIVGLSVMPDWLLTAVGLAPDDFEAKLDDMADVIARSVACNIGLPLEPS